jgi:hypothetical protein
MQRLEKNVAFARLCGHLQRGRHAGHRHHPAGQGTSAHRSTSKVLLSPVTDANFETPSYRACGAGGYWLTREAMRWFWDSYMPASERQEFTVSPLRASIEQLRGLPPALTRELLRLSQRAPV